jgi:hypothetical protein
MFEELLKNQIRGDVCLAGMLTTYKGKPAFFFQKAPQDTDRDWDRGAFPRMDYNTNNRYDPERKVSGSLDINIWCTNECSYMPEDIDTRLVELVGGTFYRDGVRDIICATWNRSDSFAFEQPSSIGGNTAPEVFGITTVFDLLEFPAQITFDPDPIQGLNNWTRENFPEMTVINLDEQPPVWKPSDHNPAIYWRFEGTTVTDRQSYAVTWYNGTFAAHVIAATVTERNKWTKAIIERLRLHGEVLLTDGSPMFAKQIQVRHNADPLREGQLLMAGQYGVLEQHRKERAQIPLNNAIFPNLNMEVRADGKRL